MRILVSTLWLGGAGGSERAAKAALAALAGERVDVVVGSRLEGHESAVHPGSRIHLHSHWRWRGADARGRLGRPLARWAVNPLRRHLFPAYDLHIAFPHSHDVAAAARAGLRLLVPGGSTPSEVGSHSVVALESPDNTRFVPPGCRSVLLPPPLGPLADGVSAPRVALPPRYYLTVFNPYHAIKGADDLLAAADEAPLPIVWCHSQQTLSFSVPPELVDHPNVVHVVDATPSELRHLYERCAAYLAFSRSEGFGWAAADALQYSRAVVTRPVGVFSFEEAHQRGVHLTGPEWRADWSKLDREPQAPAARDLGWLSPAAYRERIRSLAAQGSDAQA